MEWHNEMASRPKLSLLQEISDLNLIQICWIVHKKVIHSMLVKLIVGAWHCSFKLELTGGAVVA
jgi:hypothetical protein